MATTQNNKSQSGGANNLSQLIGENVTRWQKLFNSKDGDALSALGYAYTNNPYVQNYRTKKLTTQPLAPSRESLEGALQNPINQELTLRQASNALFVNYPLLKLNNLYADILTYRNYFYHINGNSKKPDHKKEREYLSDWRNKLQPERTFRNIALSVQREGKVAYYVRDSKKEGNKSGSDYVYLQQLPSDYIKIVGWNTASRFTVSFDFTYFWQMGTSPQQFPPIFQVYYDELNNLIPKEKRNGNALSINPYDLPRNSSVEVYYRDNKWFYWHTLPLDECFVFSQDETLPWQIPNSVGLFLQAQDLQNYLYLQQELLSLPMSAAICATLPLNKNIDGTTSTDNYGMSAEAHAYFTNIFNSAAPKGTRLFISPAEDYKFFQFENNALNNSTIVTNALQQFNSVAGVGGLNSTTEKPNIAQVKTQQTMEAAYVDKLYLQFENFVNLWWETKLNLKYKWRFKIKGSRFEDKETFMRVEKGLSMGQNYLLPEYLSYFGLQIEDAKGIQDGVITSGIYDKFSVLQSSFNSKATDKNNGRPQIKDSEIDNDNTAISIEQGTNTAEGREVMSRNFVLKNCTECGDPIHADSEYYPFCSYECMEENSERLGVSHE